MTTRGIAVHLLELGAMRLHDAARCLATGDGEGANRAVSEAERATSQAHRAILEARAANWTEAERRAYAEQWGDAFGDTAA